MNARRRQQAGSDVQLCIAGEARADRSSAAADPGDGGRHSERDVAAICEAVCGCGATVDCSGAVVAGAAPADFLFGEERTAADGTAAVQLAVSLVCGDGDGRGGVEPRGVQQESGAAAERGDRRGVFQRVLVLAQPYLSDEHFTVDGTRIEAWASQKSFRRKDDAGDRPGASGEVDFHGEKRGNETHQSTTDPEARLYKKSKGSEAKLSYLGHVLIENRHGLLVQTMLTQANGRAERDAGLLLAEKIPGVKHVTLGGDKNYDTEEFVRELRRMHITPHVAQNHTNRCSAIDRRTTRHIGYELSQQKRKRVEQSFGWMKVIGMLKKVKLRGLEKVGWLFTFTGAAYNLCRLRNLQVQSGG